MEGKEIVTFRSRLNALPIDLKVDLGEVTYQKGMLASSRRKRCIEVLESSGIEYREVGTGTNRFIIKHDGFAMKIALDKEGIADNMQEWVMSPLTSPDSAPAHEISKGGHLLVASYAPAFSSWQDMCNKRGEIIPILKKWSKRFLLGDVGFTSKNYANWGMLDGRPVCIDYAYLFPASMDLFKCYCGSKNIYPTNNYTRYECLDCRRVFEDREIRARISVEERLKLFSQVSGFELTEEFQEVEIPMRPIKESTNPDYPSRVETAMEMIKLKGGSGIV